MQSGKVKVVGLRTYYNEKKSKWDETTTMFDKPYEFVDHQSLFNSLESLVESIPQSERYNLHYTLNHIPDSATSKKQFTKYEIIPIDIDYIDDTLKEGYIQSVERIMGFDRSNFAVIDSGFGLHFLFSLKDAIYDLDELNKIKVSYTALCDLLKVDLENNNLIVTRDYPHKKIPQTTTIDVGVLRIGTLRLPGTKNVKMCQDTGSLLAERECKFITRIMVPKTLSDLKLLGNSEPTLGDNDTEYWASTDSAYIFDKCGALKEFKEKKGKVNYQKWFAAGSVITKLKDTDGKAMFHSLSSGHPSYNKAETDALIETLDKAGPHKCDTFAKSYSQCKTCPVRCSTPLSLKRKTTLSFESTGFHKSTKAGWIPYYKELLLKVVQTHNYRVVGEKNVYRYDDNEKKWIKWPMLDVRNYITDLVSRKPGDLARSNVINEASNLILNRNVDRDIFKRSEGKINFKNGWGYVKDGEFIFHAHTSESFKEGFTYCLPFDYDPDAKAPNFELFLQDIFLQREGLIKCVTEFLGYALSNDEYWEEKALILKGSGANGKSVILKVIKALIGEGNYSIVNMKNLRDAESRGALVGKIANVSDESPKDSLNDSEDFKLLTSNGGGEFEYRVLYEGRHQAINRAKFIFSTNHELNFTDKSSAVSRRLLIIPFDANFNPKKGKLTKPVNPHLYKELIKECPGIFNLCMKAYLEAKNRGYIFEPEESVRLIEDMEKASNPVKSYIEDHIYVDTYENFTVSCGARYPEYDGNAKPGELYEVEASKLYEDFVAFCDGEGFSGKFTKVNFFRHLKSELASYIPLVSRDYVLGRQAKLGTQNIRVYLLDWSPYSKL